ncbi:toll/interleukin-1 receptor domain-containing protein [Myxococcota bacterium]|nr:toll/interleukin-1 receptor domain-containing protein [Myxococcota bacterium]
MTPYDWFVAYAGPDAGFATALYGALTARGRTFLDGMEVPEGTPFPEPIKQALEASRVVIFLVSPATRRRWYLEAEVELTIGRARAGLCRIVPVLLPQTDPTHLPYGLEGLSALRWDDGVEAVVAELLLRREVGPAPPEPQPLSWADVPRLGAWNLLVPSLLLSSVVLSSLRLSVPARTTWLAGYAGMIALGAEHLICGPLGRPIAGVVGDLSRWGHGAPSHRLLAGLRRFSEFLLRRPLALLGLSLLISASATSTWAAGGRLGMPDLADLRPWLLLGTGTGAGALSWLAVRLLLPRGSWLRVLSALLLTWACAAAPFWARALEDPQDLVGNGAVAAGGVLLVVPVLRAFQAQPHLLVTSLTCLAPVLLAGLVLLVVQGTVELHRLRRGLVQGMLRTGFVAPAIFFGAGVGALWLLMDR